MPCAVLRFLLCSVTRHSRLCHAMLALRFPGSCSELGHLALHCAMPCYAVHLASANSLVMSQVTLCSMVQERKWSASFPPAGSGAPSGRACLTSCRRSPPETTSRYKLTTLLLLLLLAVSKAQLQACASPLSMDSCCFAATGGLRAQPVKAAWTLQWSSASNAACPPQNRVWCSATALNLHQSHDACPCVCWSWAMATRR